MKLYDVKYLARRMIYTHLMSPCSNYINGMSVLYATERLIYTWSALVWKLWTSYFICGRAGGSPEYAKRRGQWLAWLRQGRRLAWIANGVLNWPQVDHEQNVSMQMLVIWESGSQIHELMRLQFLHAKRRGQWLAWLRQGRRLAWIANGVLNCRKLIMNKMYRYKCW